MSSSPAEQLLESARQLRGGVGVIDTFFLDPTPANEEKALDEVKQLPKAIELFGKLSRARRPNGNL